MGDDYVVSRRGGGGRVKTFRWRKGLGEWGGGGVRLSVEKKGACGLKRLRRGRGCNVWSRGK